MFSRIPLHPLYQKGEYWYQIQIRFVTFIAQVSMRCVYAHFMCIVSFHRPHGIRKYTIHPPVGMRGVYAHFMCMVIILWPLGRQPGRFAAAMEFAFTIHSTVSLRDVYAHLTGMKNLAY